MSRYARNRTLPVILIVVIVIIAITAIVAMARAAFFSDQNNAAKEQVDTSREALLSTSTNRKVQMTVRGPIVADEQFNSYRITVTPTSRSLVTYQGYVGEQIDAVQLGNNTPAYDEFVHALDKANLTAGKQFDQTKDDTRGICASGRLFEYEIIQDNKVVKRLWTSTCRGSAGSLKASTEQLSNLFTKQIPDSTKLINKINL